jgi:hypothetical protein
MLPACKQVTAQQAQAQRPPCEVAEIFRHYGEAYRSKYRLPSTHLKVMHDIEVCRTAELGGHIEQCDVCGAERNAYNSCRNRHCPKCQAPAKARWLKARKAELLPVTYFHTVFTLPHALNPIALCNKKMICDLLFKAASETLLAFGRNPKNGLGGTLGFLAILHTWSQTVLDHFHLHCLVAAGALSCDGSRWIEPRYKDYLFPVQALAPVFRGKFMDYLQQAFDKAELIFPGTTEHLATKTGFSTLTKQLWKDNWVVYSKPPFAGPEKVLDYLGRYTHRVAISNHRIIEVQDGKVTFSYRDRKDNDTLKTTSLHPDEFIRRFLLHVLPEGFVRIRYFGFLANRDKKNNLGRCRQLLGLSAQIPPDAKQTIQELMLEFAGIDISLCPFCKKGTMTPVAPLPRPAGGAITTDNHQPAIADSS